MTQPRADWVNTTHDWAGSVDHAHLQRIRDDADGYAPGGVLHLVLEVIAYPDDEAESRSTPEVAACRAREKHCEIKVVHSSWVGPERSRHHGARVDLLRDHGPGRTSRSLDELCRRVVDSATTA